MILSGEITLNVNAIIGLAGLVTALSVLIGVIRNWFKQKDKWDGYDEKIQDINESVQAMRDEQYVQIMTLYAVLDGLKQLNCNGKVTEAKNELDKFINEMAHNQKSA
jgi:hypothetical protein